MDMERQPAAAHEVAELQPGNSLGTAWERPRGRLHGISTSMSSEEALRKAEAEGLTLIGARKKSKTGYYGVRPQRSIGHKRRPYQARVCRDGKQVSLGYFATPEEAALCVARSPAGKAVARSRAASAPPPAPALTSKGAPQQAQADGLMVVVAPSKTGFGGVYRNNPKQSKPFQATVSRDSKRVALGNVTAEEAALCVARSTPERQVATKRVRGSGGYFERVAAPPLRNEDALQQAWDHSPRGYAILGAVGLDIIYEAAAAAEAELSAEVAAEVMRC